MDEKLNDSFEALKPILEQQQDLAKKMQDFIVPPSMIEAAKKMQTAVKMPDSVINSLKVLNPDIQLPASSGVRIAKTADEEPNCKVFDKKICLSNIRELLKTSEIKIGQLEKEAGCQAGYVSRLEKPDSTGLPSIDFLMTAAKMLKVSLDVLLTVQLNKLSPTAAYIVKFLDKLSRETVECKLEWQKKTPSVLNNLECDINGNVYHPLFEYAKFYEQSDCEYPQEVERVAFVSNYFGYNSAINGDCYSLELNRNSTLYLMDVSKSVFSTKDKDAYAKEIWMYSGGSGTQFLTGSRDIPALSSLVDNLFATVAEHMKHPKLKAGIKNAIDAFMKDAVSGEFTEDDIPF